MSFEEALALVSRDEGFRATVYAMNTLLIHKGIYTQEEFQALFVEWVEKERRRKSLNRDIQKPLVRTLLSSIGWMFAVRLFPAVNSQIASSALAPAGRCGFDLSVLSSWPPSRLTPRCFRPIV